MPEAVDRSALPPGPRISWLQTAMYMADAFGYMRKCRARYGDLFTMPATNGLLVIACRPDLAREILRGREEDFEVGFGREAIEPVIGAGSMLLLAGDQHRRDRKLLSPTFHGARMRAYAEGMRSSALRRAEQWRAGDTIQLQREMQAISMDVIVEAVIGAHDVARKQELATAITEAVDEVNPLPIFFKGLQREFGGVGPWAKFQRRMKRLDALLYAQIREARDAREERDDVLFRLIEAVDDDGARFDDREIRDHMLTLLVAGHETTTTSLAWVLDEIFRNASVRTWLLDEIAALGPEPSAEALTALPALDAVCRESLRLHPVLAEFFRTVKDRYEIGGYTIPRGVTLAGSILMLNRDPEVYEAPDTFRPQRFMDARFAPEEFATFGGGHRHCLGAAFALSEMKIVVGTLLPRFELASTIDRPLRHARRNATLAVEAGAPMRVVRRLEASAARAA